MQRIAGLVVLTVLAFLSSSFFLHTQREFKDALNDSLHKSSSTYKLDHDAASDASECTCISMHAQDSDNFTMGDYYQEQCDMDNTVSHCRMHADGQEG